MIGGGRDGAQRGPSAAFVVRIVVSTLIIAGLAMYARTVNWHETWQHVTEANPVVLLAATFVNLLSLAGKAVLWWTFLRPIGVKSLPMAAKATFAGAGLNNVLVANGGEAARVMFVARAANVRSAKVLATLALERMFELVGYIALAALSVTFLELPTSLRRAWPIAWLLVAGSVAFLVYLVRRPKLPQRLDADGTRGWTARFARYMRQFAHTVGGLSTGPRVFAAMALSMVIWGLQLWTYGLTARAAHFNISLAGTVMAFLAVNLGFAVRATPGNVGVFQATYALVATTFGMDREQAIAVAFLLQAQQLIPVTLIGVALAPEFVFNRRAATSLPASTLRAPL